ncbi:MAG: cytidylyltransferase [Limnobacter sp. CACIAM 66H1]|uniref:acylneuraminate cytidylyltransferase family protein n=1 Tax=Limnobacter sp. CACIAM 66H1 TaxID=1813033 RepID=UPI0007A8926E|nr:acylneuraminate cytidylyltransferase family protein [Limnobacter sp. CACIAM 66H1]KYP11482.1 MAG: cytidylyltransferase [Limnobacter sp. CACIAM 66H1]
MKILALIPARGGSKRLPNKNLLPLGGKPLITWSIETAKDIPEIVDILVSTDCEKIASVAKTAGACVPWLRPSHLATDTASSIDVCMHGLDWYLENREKVDGLLLLQPTSPFRTRETIKKAMKIFSKYPNSAVVSFSAAESHPYWCFRPTEGKMIPFLSDAFSLETRSQDLPEAYVINGSLYLSSPDYLKTHLSFFGADVKPIFIDNRTESIDIDTQWDFFIATSVLSSRN